LQLKDLAAEQDSNRLACDDDSGPHDTSVIEAQLGAGTYWVVVKGDGPADVGSYQLNVRDMDVFDDRRLACAGAIEGSRIETSLVAGQDYTLILKGQQAGQGAYDLKLYDADNQTASGELISCTNNNGDLQRTLNEGVYYLALKGQRTADRGIYQLNMYDTTAPTQSRTYRPPVWSQSRAVGIDGISQALLENGTVVLPVMSGSPGIAAQQARAIATLTGAVRANGTPIVKNINPSGTGLGADLVQAISDLANNHALDVSVRVVYEPDAGASDFAVSVVAVPGSPGCDPAPSGTLQTRCLPGSTPRFDVTIENPAAMPVSNNPTDPYGGYHFRLELVGVNSAGGSAHYVLDTIPVYIVPDLTMGPPAPGSVQPSGRFTRDVAASGCSYWQAEGEGTVAGACSDGIDNDGDGLIDRGLRVMDPDAGVISVAADPDCMPGTCGDNVDNDGDGLTDAEDPACLVNLRMPDWTDLFFDASLPAGGRILFEACAAATEDELEGCSFGSVVSVTSNGATCAAPADCLSQVVGGVTRDGYCARDGTCQFLDPQTARPACASDAQCPNGRYQGFELASTCNTSRNECVYSTPPADVGEALTASSNFLPYLRSRVTLYADPGATRAPTLHDFWITYNCTSVQ
jgi:hypothetical protein